MIEYDEMVMTDKYDTVAKLITRITIVRCQVVTDKKGQHALVAAYNSIKVYIQQIITKYHTTV